MKESAMLSKLGEYLLKTSRSSPEKRNGRKGLENEFLIEHKVEQPKTTQKITENLLLKKRKGCFKAAISHTCFALIPNRVVQKNGKKDEKFSEFMEFFDAKNDQPNKAKTNNQTYLIASERSVTF